MRVAFKSLCVVLVSGLASVLIGCNLSQFSEPSTASSMLPAIAGKVHGGQQAISGATIQIYAANTSVSKGASTALIPGVVTTNASGGFSIGAGAYSCPTPGTLVYLVATGGNPGLPGNVNNAAISLMVVLGTCSSLSTDAFVTVNELTTVAAVEALAPFMADAADVGSDVGNPGGLAGAFATAASQVNFATGQLQTPATGIVLPSALLNTLADILAACVNTTGTTATGTGCGTLLKYAGSGGATDLVGAILSVVQAPATNVAQLFGLVSAASPFQPSLSAVPTDFTAPLIINLPRLTTALAQGYFIIIDAAQHIWVYSSADQYSSATKSYQVATGTVTIYDNNGNLLRTIGPGAGGFYLPAAGVADSFGNVWALNLNGTLSKFRADGTALSPAAGYPFPFQIPPNHYYAPGQQGNDVSSITADPSGNIWGLASAAGAGCYNELNNNGVIVTAGGNYCAVAGNNVVAEAAADGSGNVWLLGTGSIAKVSASGNQLLSGVNTNGCFDFYPTGDSRYINDTQNIIYDRLHNQLWGLGFLSIGALRSDGTQVLCDANGANLPLIPVTATSTGYEALEVVVSTVDGGGNLWFASGGEIINGSTVSYIGGLNELDPTGKVLTPYNPASGIYGLQVSNVLQPSISNGGVQGLAVDAYGNIWTASNTSFTLTKIPGLAVPKSYQ